MTRVQQLKQQIVELDQDEFRALREWFVRMDAELWDRQLDSDAKSGKLTTLAEKALRNHKAGLSQAL